MRSRHRARNLASDHGDDGVLPLRELFHKLSGTVFASSCVLRPLLARSILSATGYELFAEDLGERMTLAIITSRELGSQTIS